MASGKVKSQKDATERSSQRHPVQRSSRTSLGTGHNPESIDRRISHSDDRVRIFRRAHATHPPSRTRSHPSRTRSRSAAASDNGGNVDVDFEKSDNNDDDDDSDRQEDEDNMVGHETDASDEGEDHDDDIERDEEDLDEGEEEFHEDSDEYDGMNEGSDEHDKMNREDSEEDVDSEEDDQHDPTLIPKPDGEVGRPGRGGYSLSESLGWTKKEYRQFTNVVKECMNETIDLKKNFGKQETQSINVVCKRVTRKLPKLSRYEEAWPIKDVIRCQLNYQRTQKRLKELKADAELGRRLKTATRR